MADAGQSAQLPLWLLKLGALATAIGALATAVATVAGIFRSDPQTIVIHTAPPKAEIKAEEIPTIRKEQPLTAFVIPPLKSVDALATDSHTYPLKSDIQPLPPGTAEARFTSRDDLTLPRTGRAVPEMEAKPAPAVEPKKPRTLTVSNGETISLCGTAGLKVVVPVLGGGLSLQQSGSVPSERKNIQLNLKQASRLSATCLVELTAIRNDSNQFFDIDIREEN